MSIADVCKELAEILRKESLLMVTAESCTGGSIAAAITDLPGSSEYFAGGFVTYSNEMKTKLLGVPEEVFINHGAVSAECALAMAEGALKVSEADVAVSITGIAGPGGGTAEKPVGLVYMGFAVKGQNATSKKCNFNGDRLSIRKQCVEEALKRITEFV